MFNLRIITYERGNEMTDLLRTPLYNLYKEYGAKTIDFGGWDLPVQFSSIKAEHEAVRTKAGLFDVSHMGEIEIKGTDSLSFLQKMMTNDVAKMSVGDAQYTAMCNENGGTIDDLLIYKLADHHYLLVVNAANTEKDEQWLRTHVEGDVQIENVSEKYALLAVQGPVAEQVLQKLIPDTNLGLIRPFSFEQDVVVFGKKVLLSRTGYTGEDGFELYCQPKDASDLWREILRVGQEEGIIPCGLGARDTLRFEACLVLYGQEISETISPLEAGIGFAVKLNKEVDFIGKAALKSQKEAGIPRRLVGLEMIDRGIPRHGYPVWKDETQIGEITTGTQSPTLQKNIGLALIHASEAKIGEELEIEVRRKRLKARIISTPFYKRKR